MRRSHGCKSPLQIICHTDAQRINGEAQTPLQLARVDARIDPEFDEVNMAQVIEIGSAVHCVSACEGDIIVMGSDGVFDNLFPEEITDLCNSVLLPGEQTPTQEQALGYLARSIVKACHAKTRMKPDGQLPQAPVGQGGKGDDTSVVVAEVVQWTDTHRQLWAPHDQSQLPWQEVLRKVFPFSKCCHAAACDPYDERHHP